VVQARSHLAKGRGFEAYVLLDNFPEGAEQAEAQRLLPVASLLFDMDLGDLPAGKYEALAEALRKRKYDTAVTELAALEVSDKDEVDVEALELGIAALKDSR
jgi:hypothetical protein